jgi:hypothetical protein
LHLNLPVRSLTSWAPLSGLSTLTALSLKRQSETDHNPPLKDASSVGKLAQLQELAIENIPATSLVSCQQNLYILTLARARERVARHQASGVRGFREELP